MQPKRKWTTMQNRIITNERYIYIASIIKACYKKNNRHSFPHPTRSIRWLPTAGWVCRFSQLIMFLVYYISMVTVGAAATDWANDGLFGDGWHLFGKRQRLHTKKLQSEYGDTDLDHRMLFADA